jgi:hypothetical protein
MRVVTVSRRNPGPRQARSFRGTPYRKEVPIEGLIAVLDGAADGVLADVALMVALPRTVSLS